MNYAELIKQIRKELIITQEELASILDVSFSSINRWENGHYEPTIKAKRKIVQLCKKKNIYIRSDRK